MNLISYRIAHEAVLNSVIHCMNVHVLEKGAWKSTLETWTEEDGKNLKFCIQTQVAIGNWHCITDYCITHLVLTKRLAPSTATSTCNSTCLCTVPSVYYTPSQHLTNTQSAIGYEAVSTGPDQKFFLLILDNFPHTHEPDLCAWAYVHGV